MPINTTEIFPRTPKISSGKLLTANIASDGTGSVVTVFTAGESGAKIDQIKIRSLGSNVSTVVRFFINNGSTNEDEENNILVHETRVDKTTVSEIEGLPDYDVVIRKGGVAFSPIPFLPAGYKINVTTGKTLSSGLQVTVHGYEYDEVTPELLNGLSFADDDTNSDSTIITLGAPSVPGNTFRYFVSINANPVGIPDTGYDLSAWTAVADGDSIVAPHGQHIGVAEVDGSNLCVQFSDALTVTETIAMVSVGTPTGDAIVGEVLTAGALSPLGASVTYQWYSCATVDGTYAEIVGATASTYTLVTADIGDFIIVLATGYDNYTGIVQSTATAQVIPILMESVGVIIGDAIVGEELTAGALSPLGATVTYQWYSCATVDGTYAEIVGATASTYTLVTGDVNKFIKVYATGTGDYTGEVESPATDLVTPVFGDNMIRLTVDDDFVGFKGWVTNELSAVSSGDMTVYWGDGTSTTQSLGGVFNYTYPSPQGIERTILITSVEPITEFRVRGIAQGYKTAEFNTPNLISAQELILNCPLLTSITLPDTLLEVESALNMLYEDLLLPSIDLSSFVNLLDGENMLRNCQSLTSITGLSALSNLTSAKYMFGQCWSLSSIDLSALLSVEDLQSVVSGCTSLETIDVSNLSLVTNINNFISGCTALLTLNATGLGSAGLGIAGTPFTNINPNAVLDFTNAKFDGTIPDNFYDSLPVRSTMGTTGEGELILVGVTSLGNYSIATGKNWLVTRTPMLSVGTPIGTAQSGEVLTAGALDPLGADVTYQWYSCAIVDGTYAEIVGATASTYTLVIGDVGNFIKVYATGTGDYTGTVESTATAVVRQVCPSLSNGLSFADDDANDTDTVITLGAPSTPGNTFVYKISVDSNAVPTPEIGDNLSTWTAVINSASITATNGKHIGVAEIDGSSLAVQFSDATAVTLPE